MVRSLVINYVYRYDPRIPVKCQKWGMTLEELEQVHIDYARAFSQSSEVNVCGNAVSLAHHFEYVNDTKIICKFILY